MSATTLEPCSSSTTDWIINMFEAEQKSAVFGSLAGYLNTATFADVSLACRNQVLRAHKVVLAASSKFFSDLFKHNPAIDVVDLDRELSPNGLDLTYEDVQLIIGILYCVGTVEISPERIESLLLIAQVLGIPTLIHLLKRIKRSLSATPDPSYSQSFTVKPGSTFQSFDDHQESLQKQRSSSSVSFFSLASPRCSTASFANRSNNTNVLESLDPSFLQQLNNLHQIDDIENALMPHLQNNATSNSFVDSIEAYDESSIKSSNSLPFDSSGFGKLLPESNGDLSTRPVPLLPDRNLMSVDNVSEPLTPLDRHDQPSKPQSPPSLENKDREEAPKEKNESLSQEDGRVQAPKEKNKSTDDELENVIVASPKPKNQSTLLEDAPRIKNPPEPLPSDDDQFDKVESLSQNTEIESAEKEIEECESDEIRVNLDSIASNGKSIRLSIPGASNGSVTLNFTAEALTEMRNSFMMNKSSVSPSDKVDDEVSSSTQPESSDSPIVAGSSRRSVAGVSALKRRRKKEKKSSNKLDDRKNKSVYKCSLCNQSFSSQKAFEKHGNFHIEQSSCTCIECGKTFRKRWALEQHLAIDHRSGESPNDHQANCEDCGKTFGWKRNLLAHVLLHHQKEIRYRCRYCPLTFLKKKLYLNHHTNKHMDKPPTWCQLCFKVFENSKVLEDHQCDGLENTGERVICHKPHSESNKKTFSFSNLKDVESHIAEFHPHEKIDCQMKSSCPVCHKKFLLKRYLFIHVRRFHDEETNKFSEETNNKLTCRVCKKVFLYEMDRKNHELVHENNKKFSCSECDKSYFWKKALLSHMKASHRHGDQKPEYKCEVCGKKLSNKYKLKYHMTVHSDVKLFMCNICGIKFKAQDNVLRHKKKYHKTPIKPSHLPVEEEAPPTTPHSSSSSSTENDKS